MNTNHSAELNELIRLAALLSEVYELPQVISNYANDRIIYTSKRFTLMTGLELNPENVEHIFTYDDVIHPKDIKILAEINQNGKKIMTQTFKEKPFAKLFLTYNIKIKQANNEYKPMKAVLKPVYFNVDGTPKYVATTFVPVIQKGYRRFALYTESNSGNELFYSSLRKKFVTHETLELKHIEIEILKHAAKGHNSAQIAKKLDIKTDLVKYYKKNIYNKYHVSSMSEAVYIALFYELI
jgi:DNA-binding CsgD family transcriptional regulator